MKPETALSQVLTHLNRERENYDAYTSPMEAHAYLEDARDALWEAIRRGDSKTIVRTKAKQVAVTAMRIMTDCT